MKKNLFRFTAFMLALTGIQAAFAAQPAICPSVSAIRPIGVSRLAFQDDTGLWATGRRDQMYGTADHWSFIVGKIQATDANDAYLKATDSLNSLDFQIGPVMGPIGKWVCIYNTAQAYTAVAINPPVAVNSDIASLFLGR